MLANSVTLHIANEFLKFSSQKGVKEGEKRMAILWREFYSFESRKYENFKSLKIVKIVQENSNYLHVKS